MATVIEIINEKQIKVSGVTGYVKHASRHLPGGSDPIQLATTGQAGLMSQAQATKLDGIEPGATGPMSGAEIKTAYEGEDDTNVFDDAAESKLAGIEPNAKDDQNAVDVPYNNADSGLDSTDVKGALDELDTEKITIAQANSAAIKYAIALG